MVGTESQKLRPTPHPKDIRKQKQLSEGKTVGWLDLVDVTRATRVGLITGKSVKREIAITKEKSKAKRNTVRGCGFPAVTVHVVTSATLFSC